MTAGLDRTFDAAKLKGNPDLSIYTRLVADNGLPFAVQCLPVNTDSAFVIPVGVDFKAGGILSFAAKNRVMPSGSTLVLEDRLKGIFTDLMLTTEGYSSYIEAGTSGTGRFYIHTSHAKVDVGNQAENKLQVWAAGKKIFLVGETTGISELRLYSLDGRLLKQFPAESIHANSLNAEELSDGLYLFTVSGKTGKYTSWKLFLGGY